jgi:hypothetical protein
MHSRLQPSNLCYDDVAADGFEIIADKTKILDLNLIAFCGNNYYNLMMLKIMLMSCHTSLLINNG